MTENHWEHEPRVLKLLDYFRKFRNTDGLLERLDGGGEIREVILATSATVDGQTTAHYLSDQLAGAGVEITELAHGVPVGGELDYLDDGTLGAALKDRRPV